MKGPTPRLLKKFACRCLRLRRYLNCPGDGRIRAQIRAETLLWALIIGEVLRQGAFHAVEALVRSRARGALGVPRWFGDDALAYFTERLDLAAMRQALAQALQQAKRNKAFEKCRFVGLAVDGTGGGRSRTEHCRFCRATRDGEGQVTGYNHRFSLIAVVGSDLVLPLDVEPYGPGDSELAASRRVLERAVEHLGPRFADYVVGDGEYAGAPFLHAAGELGLRVVVRLKANLPELLHAAEARFTGCPPMQTFDSGKDRVEIWDASDFDPWDSLKWSTVRVLRYRQLKPDGTVFEAYWLTDFPESEVGSRGLYTIAKSRWQIENQAFNDGKNRYGLEKIRHHHENSLVVGWMMSCLAMVIERLYRLRYLHRGGHPARSAMDLLRTLSLSLGGKRATDTS